MKIIEKKLDDLIPYANNPRQNDNAVQGVAESIRQFGFKNPIIIDKDNVIVAGHTRYKASRLIGLKTVPTIIADDLTEAQVRAFRIADNRTAEAATWDEILLAEELNAVKDDFDMEALGFGELLKELDADTVEDEYEVELPEEPKSQYGDVYQLGRHRLMCGDATKLEDMTKLLAGARVDLLITDPPYNVDYEGTAGKIKNDHMGDSEYRKFLFDSLSCADAVMKPGAVFYIWHDDSEGYNVRGACRDIGWDVRQCLIWNKSSLVMGRQDYHWKHEPCLYGWKSGGSHLWASDRKQTTVLEFDKPTQSKEHPTVKPIKLFDYQIQNNTKKEDVVLDPFGGSGTTVVASEQNGRICYTMELDPKYADVIVDRWEKLTGQTATKVN